MLLDGRLSIAGFGGTEGPAGRWRWLRAVRRDAVKIDANENRTCLYFGRLHEVVGEGGSGGNEGAANHPAHLTRFQALRERRINRVSAQRRLQERQHEDRAAEGGGEPNQLQGVESRVFHVASLSVVAATARRL